MFSTKQHSNLKTPWTTQIIIGILFACLGYAGCVNADYTKEKQPIDPEEKLVKTINEYWVHKIARNFEKCYALEDPAYRRDVILVDYLKSFGAGVTWLEAKIDRVKIDKSQAQAHLNIKYLWHMVQLAPEGGFKATVNDKWRLVDGKWYHVITPSPLRSKQSPGKQSSKEKQPIDNETEAKAKKTISEKKAP